MNPSISPYTPVAIRPVHYKDLEAIENLAIQCEEPAKYGYSVTWEQKLQEVRSRYGLLKFLSWFPNPCQHDFHVYVAENKQQLVGLIQISPCNINRSTWRVERVLADANVPDLALSSDHKSIGSQLMRYCFETIWEARTWILEVNVNAKTTLALYRQNGFQPLAQLTYWAIAPEILSQLAEQDPDLPNLLPVSNADAYLIYQLDTVAMPPLLRQVFDRHISDFKTNFLSRILNKLKHWFGKKEIVEGYVFEPQRKAAIGYFCLNLCHDGSQPHQAELTVHPAYTWLYPKLMAQMAQVTQNFPPQSLQLTSTDYQPEREEFLEKSGAERIEHTLLMSRSVWHKLRESKPLEGLQLSEVLQGLQPARTPIPSRISWLKSVPNPAQEHSDNNEEQAKKPESPKQPPNGHHA